MRMLSRVPVPGWINCNCKQCRRDRPRAKDIQKRIKRRRESRDVRREVLEETSQ